MYHSFKQKKKKKTCTGVSKRDKPFQVTLNSSQFSKLDFYIGLDIESTGRFKSKGGRNQKFLETNKHTPLALIN